MHAFRHALVAAVLALSIGGREVACAESAHSESLTSLLACHRQLLADARELREQSLAAIRTRDLDRVVIASAASQVVSSVNNNLLMVHSLATLRTHMKCEPDRKNVQSLLTPLRQVTIESLERADTVLAGYEGGHESGPAAEKLISRARGNLRGALAILSTMSP